MPATLPLFKTLPPLATREELAPGAWVLRGFASDIAENLLAEIERIATQSPFRHLVTPSSKTMSVAMTHCGRLGWFSDRHGYSPSSRAMPRAKQVSMITRRTCA